MAFFTARQPILDLNRNLYGYELLFRNSLENVFPEVDPEQATSKIIENLQFNLGLTKVSAGKFAFINFTEQALLNGYPKLLPKEQVVIEVLETVNPTKEVMACLKELAEQNYQLALDDFIHNPAWEEFYQHCHIIKIDCKEISQNELNQVVLVKRRYPHLKFLAEKVENYEEFKRYASLGFDLFQGFFFSKPEVISNVSISSSNAQLTSLLNEVNQPELNLNEVTTIFETDVSLSFKLLRYAQSPLFARAKKIDSIKQAVVTLGQNELKRFVMFLVAVSFGENKPTELVKLSLQRAKFCEQLSMLKGKDDVSQGAFLAGMLSLIDAMLDSDITSLISNMPLADNIKHALIKSEGWIADSIKVCKIIERGDWVKIEKTSNLLKIDMQAMLEKYNEAENWAEERISFLL